MSDTFQRLLQIEQGEVARRAIICNDHKVKARMRQVVAPISPLASEPLWTAFVEARLQRYSRQEIGSDGTVRP